MYQDEDDEEEQKKDPAAGRLDAAKSKFDDVNRKNRELQASLDEQADSQPYFSTLSAPLFLGLDGHAENSVRTVQARMMELFRLLWTH